MNWIFQDKPFERFEQIIDQQEIRNNVAIEYNSFNSYLASQRNDYGKNSNTLHSGNKSFQRTMTR